MSISRAEQLQNQNEQVVTFTLVELLTSLVFIAMILALVLRSEALKDLDPSRENMLRLRTQLEAAQRDLRLVKRENSVLKDELEAQRSLVRRLMAESGQPLPPNEVVVIPAAKYQENRNSGEVAKEQQVQINGLLKEIAALKGGASVTRPFCTTNSGYLLNVRLNGDGTLTATPNWPSIASAAVSKIDGIQAFRSGRPMTRSAFNAAAGRVNRWAQRQVVPCAFRVRVGYSHGSIPLYVKQLSWVEQHFYVARAR